MKVYDLRFSTSFQLSAIPPYDFALTVRKPAGWSFLTPYEAFEDSILWTAMRMPSGEMFGLKLKSTGTVEKPKVFCEVHSSRKLSVAERKRLLGVVSWMLSLEEDVKPFYALAKRDSLVKALVEDLYGMRRTKRPDVFPQLILAVTLQMAPIARSDQMMNLLIKGYGEKVLFDGKEVLCWPSPAVVAQENVRELKERCKLGYRAPAVKAIAQAMSEGFPTLQELERMSADEAKAKLMELKGIGEYSADIVSPHFGFPLDVWSAKIFSLLLLGEEPDSPRTVIPKLKKIAEKRWGRWRGYVFTHVLNDMPNLSKRLRLNLEEL
jgi:3-methyladenine DNA glycosylase/8-oxoguanine DNA glycosylase